MADVHALEAHKKKHIVLVHGVCMGAWCWYKLKTLLENEGFTVTALDMLASGVNETPLDQVSTFRYYSSPLFDFMNCLPPYEKVILVGNCIGGIGIAMAADLYPNKVLATVFLGAFMPDTKNAPSYVLDMFSKWLPEDFWVDTDTYHRAGKDVILLGPRFLSTNLYNLSPKEDAKLAAMLVRPSSLFLEDLAMEPSLTDEGYGFVDRVVIIATGAKSITEEFNKWQMQNAGVSSFKIIEDADDMAMVSKPQEVFNILQEISNSYGQ